MLKQENSFKKNCMFFMTFFLYVMYEIIFTKRG